MYHKLLQRQIQKLIGDEVISEKVSNFLRSVSASYDHFEQDRTMLERSIEISSEEMIELNRCVRKAHDELKSLFDNIDEVFFSVSFPDLELLQMSPACKNVFGYDSSYFSDKKSLWYDLILDEDKHIIDNNYKLIFSDEPFLKEYRFTRADGEIRWAESKMKSTFDASGILIRIDGVTSDITNRKESEISIAISEARYRAIIQSSHDLIQSVNASGQIEFVNNSWHQVLGYTTEDIKTLRVFDIINPQHLNECIGMFQQVFQGKSLNNIRTEFVCKNGEIKIFEGNVVPIFTNEEVTGTQAFFRDVTEREKAEENIRKHEKRFRSLIENNEDGISLLDQNGLIVYQSPSVDRMLGFTLDDRIGKTCRDFVHEDDLHITDQIFGFIIDNPHSPYPFQYRKRCKSGKYIWTEGTFINMLEDESVNAIVVNFRDVTIRKEAEAEIKKVNEDLKINLNRLKEVQRIAALGSWLEDVKKKTILRSAEFYNILETPHSETPYTVDQFMSFLHPEDREIVLDKYNIAMKHKTPFQYEARLLMKDGRIKNIFGNGNFIFDEKGEVEKMHGIIQDITERKQSQIELEKNVLELKKSNSELDKFVYSVSHDLRAPLSSLMGIIEIIKFDTADENVHSHVDRMNLSIKKLDGFISDILDYSRNARMELKSEEIDLHEMLNEISQNLKYMGNNNRHVDIIFDIKNNVPLYSDRTRLSVVFNNLISNAIRYQNTVIENPFVKIAVDISEQNVSIDVIDNGIGISPDNTEMVFDMFYRVSKKSAGSGLGLYIVKEAINKLEGNIVVQSVVNSGTTFSISIPNSYNNI